MEFSPSLISHQASVDVKPYLLTYSRQSESSRDCVSEEVSGALSVPNKPSGFCGRKAVFTTTTTLGSQQMCP